MTDLSRFGWSADDLRLVLGDVAKSWRTQPRVPSGPKGGEWTSEGGFVPLSGFRDLVTSQRFADAGVELPQSARRKPISPLPEVSQPKPKTVINPPIRVDSYYSDEMGGPGPAEGRVAWTRVCYGVIPSEHKKLLAETESCKRIRLGEPMTITVAVGAGSKAAGHYNPGHGEIVIGPNRSLIAHKKILVHETGHAIDNAVAKRTKVRGANYASEVYPIHTGKTGKPVMLVDIFREEAHAYEEHYGVRGVLDYYKQSGREAFAETYRVAFGGMDGIGWHGDSGKMAASYFPKSIAAVKQLIRMTGIDS